MTHPLTARTTRRVLLVAGLAAALAACGRKGALEPPPGSEQGKQLEQRRNAQSEQTGTPNLRGGGRRPPPIQRPKESFILDPLLD